MTMIKLSIGYFSFLIFTEIFKIYFYEDGCSVCMYVCAPCEFLGPVYSEKGIGSLGTKCQMFVSHRVGPGG